MTHQEHDCLQTIWDYLKLDQPLQKADVMVVLGSLQTQPAERAAELHFRGYAPLLVMSGGFGHITKDMSSRPEADIFADIARSKGVPDSTILIENRSSNTAENITMSHTLLKKKGITVKKVLLVHKKYDERRTLATFNKQWPDMDATITSPDITLDKWLATPLKARNHIDVLMGILHRIMIYPAKGFMVEQIIPYDVQAAFDTMVGLGHTAGLVKEV